MYGRLWSRGSQFTPGHYWLSGGRQPYSNIRETLVTFDRCAAGKWVKRRFRLTRSTDFKRVRRIGKSYAHPLIVFIIAPNDLQQVRVGIVAGRAVGGAVERNRIKRRLRACIDTWLDCLSGGWDLIFLARKPMDQAGFAEICAAVQGLIKRAGLFYD